MNRLNKLTLLQMGGIVLAGAGAYYLWTKKGSTITTTAKVASKVRTRRSEYYLGFRDNK